MRYSYHWLKELSGTKKSADRVAELLLRHAFEVETVCPYPHALAHVVVGEVERVEPHPSAERLQLCRVRTSKTDVRLIVCGAPNVAAGQRVAVALPGAHLPQGQAIERTEIRGKKSDGMICSEQELGLGTTHDGILVLPEEAPVGAELAKWLGVEDILLDVKILPDRSDALSHQGLAREIAALDGHAPQFAEKSGKPLRPPAYQRGPKITLHDKEGCSRYFGLYFEGVAVRPSPLWLRARLSVLGFRSINNIVDATNYLMLLSGQPLHAFDADLITGSVQVRRARRGEKLNLLDGQQYTLTDEDIVVADTRRAVALAGIMGGRDTSVSDKSKRIFLELARFDARHVRRTRTRLNLATEASYRFERGVDAAGIGEVARLAAELIRDLSGAKLMGIRDVSLARPRPTRITLHLERIATVLGTNVPAFEAVQYLALDGLTVKKRSNLLQVTVPPRRPDLIDEWDLIEEIGRLRGYEKIPARTPTLPLRMPPLSREMHFERLAKDRLCGLGFSEIMTYGFISKRDMELFRLAETEHLSLANPIHPEQHYLRRSLLPRMAQAAGENLRHNSPLFLFEWGSVFSRARRSGVQEEEHLALAYAGTDQESSDAFSRLKGSLEAFVAGLGGEGECVPALTPPPYFHPAACADILLSGERVGILGLLDPFVRRAGAFPVGAAYAELAVSSLRQLLGKQRDFVPLARFPFVERDISLVFRENAKQRVMVADIERLIRDAGTALLRSVTLFDIYERDGNKNVAFHLAFGAEDRTLSSDEVDVIFRNIVMEADKHLGAALHL